MTSQRRWPAYALAALFLAYAAGKAAFALQHRLGFPGGPPAPAEYFMDPAFAQWMAAASGVLGACVTLATLGRWVPRRLMPAVLAVMFLAVGGGAGIMIVDGFVGIGIGWRWYHGVVGVVVIALFVETVRCYVVRSWPRDPLTRDHHRQPGRLRARRGAS
ncbi:hypothetical protein ACIBG8_02185 [Nonomuraea sp. NPDC050556]|uniref:hypothetical protein n=1 Tax=Nonomuraea sp. NPDC050556 TaxID=3364369 RepID=UPI0037B80798